MSIKLFEGEVEVGEFEDISVAIARCNCPPAGSAAFVLEIGTITHTTFESFKGKEYRIVGPDHKLYNCKIDSIRTPKILGDIWPYVTVLSVEGIGYLDINNKKNEYIQSDQGFIC